MKTYEINYKRIDKTTDIHENILFHLNEMEAENADEAISLYLDSIKETVDNSQYDLNISVKKSEQTYEDK